MRTFRYANTNEYVYKTLPLHMQPYYGKVRGVWKREKEGAWECGGDLRERIRLRMKFLEQEGWCAFMCCMR